MPTQIDDSQIKSVKLEKLIESVGHIKAPIEDPNDLPDIASDGERIYIKSLKKDFIYDESTKSWIPFSNSLPSSEEKVVVFVIQKPSTGPQKVEIKFPYQGYVSEISASLVEPSATDFVIQVQKCSQENYENNVVWENIGDPITILQDKKAASIVFDNNENVVSPNDYFRIDIKELDQQAEGLTFNIKIKLT